MLTRASHLTGEPALIFQHVAQSVEDLVAKENVNRVCSRSPGTFSFRCIKTLIPPVIYNREGGYRAGNSYHRHKFEWIKQVQEKNRPAFPGRPTDRGSGDRPRQLSLRVPRVRYDPRRSPGSPGTGVPSRRSGSFRGTSRPFRFPGRPTTGDRRRYGETFRCPPPN